MTALFRLGLLAFICGSLATRAFGSTPGADASTPDTQQQKGDSEATQMKAELQHVKDAVNAAKKPEDLDPILFELQKYQNNGIETLVTPENQGLYQQLVSALEFTRQWQNYLSHSAAGDADQARNDLQALTQNNQGASLIPRSRLLALLANPIPGGAAHGAAPSAPPPSEAQKIIDDINTLDDLQTALTQLGTLGERDPIAREYAEHLAPMVEAYTDLKQGLPTNVNINFMGDVTGAGVSVKANNMLLKFILQHYFDSYRGAPPADNETAAAYATRVKTDALAGQDWALLKKTLNVHSYLFRNIAGAGGAPDNEAAGLDDMISGINQETAGQYALAVGSFQTALKAGSLDIPAKFIGAQLDAIKRDHPAEYDAGMESFLTPQMPSSYYPGYPGGMNPAMYNAMMNQRFRPPGYPSTPPAPAQPNPVLSIPATKASAPPPTPPSTNAPASTNSPDATK